MRALVFRPAIPRLVAALAYVRLSGSPAAFGLGVVAALRGLGIDVRITILTRHRFQSEQALRLGVDQAVGDAGGDAYENLAEALGTVVLGCHRYNRLLKDGFAVVYDCVGSAATPYDALRWCRPRGAVVLLGVDLFPGVLDRPPMWHNEVDVVGAVSYGAEVMGWP